MGSLTCISFPFLSNITKGQIKDAIKIHYINPNAAKCKDRATSAFPQKMRFIEAKKGLRVSGLVKRRPNEEPYMLLTSLKR